MSLGNEMHEWRKQLVEKLLLNGVKAEDLEGQVSAAELVVFGGQVATVTIEVPLKHAKELKTILLDFSQKNGSFVIAKTDN
ncbi:MULTISPECIES: hypothetical protein [Acinetobacter]|uniref:hypothetical protein n=1 Tax=Acinetobacter TaxID=469 RepID=UPI0015D361AA|nr:MULTISPECIES: hypothetical protein [Acinetobacter]MCL6240623.1 hypothetical protein [Acinetobacter amyesii]